MAVIEQVEVDGRRVDRPLWRSPSADPVRAPTPVGRSTPRHPSVTPDARAGTMVRPTLPRFRRYEPPVGGSTRAGDLRPASCGSAHLGVRPEPAPAARDRSVVELEIGEREGSAPEVVAPSVRDDEAEACQARHDAFIDLARIEREGFDRVVAPLPVRVPRTSGHRFGSVHPVSAGAALGPTLQPTEPILRSGGSTPVWRSPLSARLRVPIRVRPPRWRKWKAKVRRRLRRPTTTHPLDRTAVVLAVLSGLAAVASVAGLVADTHVGPTRSFVATMAPLYRDPAVADRLSADLADAVDPEGAMEPAQQADLRRATHTLVMTPEFGTLWEQSLRDARASTLTSTSLGGHDVVVLQEAYGAELRRLVGLVDGAATWSTVAAVGLVLAFLIRSPNRLRACSLLGATTAGAGVVAWFLVPGATRVLAGLVSGDALTPLTAAAGARLVGPVRTGLVVLVVVSVVVALLGRVEEARTAPLFTVVEDDYAVRLPGMPRSSSRSLRGRSVRRRHGAFPVRLR